MPVPNTELTSLEKMIVLEWRRVEAATGAGPSLKHLANHCGVYPNAIVHAKRQLKKKGFLVDKKITAIRLKLSQKGMKVAP